MIEEDKNIKEKNMQPHDLFNDFDEFPPEGFEDDLSPENLEYLGEICEGYHTEDYQKKELRIDWNPYEAFSSAFLDKHYELVLLNIFHHIMAFLLFPADCACKERCFCSRWRQKVILSLNTARYNQLCCAKKNHYTVKSLSLALAITIILRMRAVRATIFFFPRSIRLS